MKHTITLGSYETDDRATLEIEMRTKTSCAPHYTIDGEPVQEYTELSICGTTRNSAGQCVDEIRRLHGDNRNVLRLCELWDRWHLNGLNAGMREQMEFLGSYRKRHDYANDYDRDTLGLQASNLLTVNGIRYGNAWLVEIIPPAVLNEINELAQALSE